jgi:hypothetical protein
VDRLRSRRHARHGLPGRNQPRKHGQHRHELRLRPPYTNQSREPRPKGWCGSYNNVSTYGRGIWRVIRRVENGRCKIEEITDSDRLANFLEEFGYPDLLDELVPEAT